MFSATLSGISELFQFKDFLERLIVILIVRIILQSKMIQIRIAKEKGA